MRTSLKNPYLRVALPSVRGPGPGTPDEQDLRAELDGGSPGVVHVGVDEPGCRVAWRVRDDMKEKLWRLLAGTNGGKKRARIIKTLDDRPCSTSQLADRLDERYNTVRYHLEILREEDVVKSSGNDYGMMYFLTDEFEQHFAEFEEIEQHLDIEC